MKTVFDTCLYIELLRTGKHLDLFQSREQIRYLSPIVLMELMTGAIHPSQKKTVEQLITPYSKAKRIIPLQAEHYYKAGVVLAKIFSKQKSHRKGFSHDILIALSSASIGATLYTKNKKDFQQISRYIPLKTVYL